MKISLILAILVVLMAACQQKSYVYIVRHAEKSTEPTADPYLTREGRQRAISLKNKLQRKHIQYIYSTKFNRTRETATPLGSEIGVSITPYDSLGKLFKTVKGLKQNVLIVGHSNSVINLLDSFHVAHTMKSIPDDRFGDLFIITRKKGKVTGYKETYFGRPPVSTSAATTQMK